MCSNFVKVVPSTLQIATHTQAKCRRKLNYKLLFEPNIAGYIATVIKILDAILALLSSSHILTSMAYKSNLNLWHCPLLSARFHKKPVPRGLPDNYCDYCEMGRYRIVFWTCKQTIFMLNAITPLMLWCAYTRQPSFGNQTLDRV